MKFKILLSIILLALCSLSKKQYEKNQIDRAIRYLRDNHINKYYRWNLSENNKTIDLICIEHSDDLQPLGTYDELIFYYERKVIEKVDPGYCHLLDIINIYYYGKELLFTFWTAGIYEQTKVYLYDKGKIKNIFNFSPHVGYPNITYDEDSKELILEIPFKESHAMPEDTYIYVFKDNHFVLNKIIKRNLNEKDDKQSN